MLAGFSCLTSLANLSYEDTLITPDLNQLIQEVTETFKIYFKIYFSISLLLFSLANIVPISLSSLLITI